MEIFYNFNGLVCAFTLGMLSCLAAVLIGAFIERTSYLIKGKELKKAKNIGLPAFRKAK